ncbi:endonuclease domain-containing protein [Thermodesulfobacteriota bacterium]
MPSDFPFGKGHNASFPPFEKGGQGGLKMAIEVDVNMRKQILPYNRSLKENARYLRKNMTQSEIILWSELRAKQLLGVQFYRQKPIGDYIVDLFAPKANLAIEVDGSQHQEKRHIIRDMERDKYLARRGILVLRFNSREVLKNTDAVVDAVYRTVMERVVC